MRATAKIQLPAGVRMEGKSAPFFERGDAAKGVARVEITDVRDVDKKTIEVTFDIDVEVEVILRNDRGQHNPNIQVAFVMPAAGEGRPTS